MDIRSVISAAKALKEVKEMEAKSAHLKADSWNEHAAIEAKFVVGLVIGIYLLAALIPSAITALNGTNTTGWTATQLAIWGVLSVIILAVVIMKISE